MTEREGSERRVADKGCGRTGEMGRFALEKGAEIVVTAGSAKRKKSTTVAVVAVVAPKDPLVAAVGSPCLECENSIVVDVLPRPSIIFPRMSDYPSTIARDWSRSL